MLTESIIGVLKEFDVNINKMESFVSDGASVMTEIHYSVQFLEIKLNTLKGLKEF